MSETLQCRDAGGGKCPNQNSFSEAVERSGSHASRWLPWIYLDLAELIIVTLNPSLPVRHLRAYRRALGPRATPPETLWLANPGQGTLIITMASGGEQRASLVPSGLNIVSRSEVCNQESSRRSGRAAGSSSSALRCQHGRGSWVWVMVSMSEQCGGHEEIMWEIDHINCGLWVRFLHG